MELIYIGNMMNELKNVLLLLLFVFGQCKSQEGMYHNALALSYCSKDSWPSPAKGMYILVYSRELYSWVSTSSFWSDAGRRHFSSC